MPDLPYQEDLLPYAKGDLSPTEAVRVEEAVRKSAALREELAAMQRTLTWLSEHWPNEEPVAGNWERLRQAAERTPQEKRMRPSLPDLIQELGPRSRRRRVGLGLAIAASLMLALWISVQGPPQPPEPPRPRAELVAWLGDVAVLDALSSAETPRPFDPAGPNPLYGGQRLVTRATGRATLRLPDRSQLVLEPFTSVRMLARRTPDESHELQLERGRVAFDVTPRRVEIATPDNHLVSPNERPATTSIPFVVYTAHAELRVRGTKFVVEVTDDVTLVVVMEGRVEVYSPPIAVAERKSAMVSPGMFAALGTLPALTAKLPDAPDLHPPDPNSPTSGNPLGATPTDPAVIRLVCRPLIDVSLEITPREIDPRSDDSRAAITLRNVSPFVVKVDYAMNHDNIKLNCESSIVAMPVWMPVRPVRATLEPSEAKSYECLLKPVMHGQPYGTYYLSAMFDGRLSVDKVVPPEFDAEPWRRFGGRSVSRPKSVLYGERK